MLPRSVPNETLELIIEAPDYRFKQRVEELWIRDRRRQIDWAKSIDDPNWRLFDPGRNRTGMVGMERRDAIRGAPEEAVIESQFPQLIKARLIPYRFTDIMWLTNQHKCKAHQEVCRPRHLRESHGIEIPVQRWLERYQRRSRPAWEMHPVDVDVANTYSLVIDL